MTRENQTLHNVEIYHRRSMWFRYQPDPSRSVRRTAKCYGSEWSGRRRQRLA
jgi:hypothetical protein